MRNKDKYINIQLTYNILKYLFVYRIKQPFSFLIIRLVVFKLKKSKTLSKNFKTVALKKNTNSSISKTLLTVVKISTQLNQYLEKVAQYNLLSES